MRTRLIYLILLTTAALLGSMPVSAASSPKIKYPGGRHYIWRYTLKDKHGSPYSLSHPQRWLSRKSIERRRRQGLALDSTDLPVNPAYLKQFERACQESMRSGRKTGTESAVVGWSRWQNTVLVRSNDTTLFHRLETFQFISRMEKVWVSSDSIEKSLPRFTVHETFNPWDSVKNETYGNAREQLEMLQGHRLHNIGLRGRGITIAVLDGGFRNVDVIPAFQHVDIAGTHDFVYPHSPYFYRETDHGTKVLSAMAANERTVLVGSAPEARYWLLRCEDQQTEQPVEEDYWTMAAEFADSAGVDIINSSLGYNEYDNFKGYYHQRDLDGNTAFISRSASMLARKGIILVNSAGNSGMGSWKKIAFPADAHEMLTVGALQQNQQCAPFSSVGPTQDGRTKPDVMALGSPTALISGRGTLVRDMGTSFAAPLVTGLVACLWQALPQLSALEIINLVRQTSSQYQEPDNIYGYGTPNFWRAYMIGKLE